MAEIVLALATSHTPQLSVADWRLLQTKDETDPTLDYPALTAAAKTDIGREITPEKYRGRFQACQDALKVLGDTLREARADVVVTFGDDQHEQFLDDNMPTFAVYHGPDMTIPPRTGPLPEWKKSEQQGWAETAPLYCNHTELAEHLIAWLSDHEFDIARTNRLREGIGHAFSFLYRRLLPGSTLPMVPVMVNTYYPPNQPTPGRCYALGQCVEAGLNGRTTAYEFKQHERGGRNGLATLSLVLEMASPCDLLVLLLGVNDAYAVPDFTAEHARDGVRALVQAARGAPMPDGCACPPILIVAPPLMRDEAFGDPDCPGSPAMQREIKRIAPLYRALAEDLGCGFLTQRRQLRLLPATACIWSLTSPPRLAALWRRWSRRCSLRRAARAAHNFTCLSGSVQDVYAMLALNVAFSEFRGPEKMQADIAGPVPLMKKYGADVVSRGECDSLANRDRGVLQ